MKDITGSVVTSVSTCGRRATGPAWPTTTSAAGRSVGPTTTSTTTTPAGSPATIAHNNARNQTSILPGDPFCKDMLSGFALICTTEKSCTLTWKSITWQQKVLLYAAVIKMLKGAAMIRVQFS